ncbi:MAG: hypothetical protein HXS52_05760 [Theionarchaea archaeon]|nr:hypothetical protein [Theionarchaea archaeon]
MIKQRESCGASLIRQKARKDFCETLYKQFRGMIEGVFDGTETGHSNRTQRCLRHTRKTHVMLLAVVQNLKVYTKVIELLRGGMIHWTNHGLAPELPNMLTAGSIHRVAFCIEGIHHYTCPELPPQY